MKILNSNCTKEELLDFIKISLSKDDEDKNPFWNLPIISSETEMKEGGWWREVAKTKSIGDIFEECGYTEDEISNGGSFMQVSAYLRVAVSIIKDLIEEKNANSI